MSIRNDFDNARPPSPPRLRGTDLPEDVDGPYIEPEQFLSGYPILPEDMGKRAFHSVWRDLGWHLGDTSSLLPDIDDLPQAKLYEMNQRLLEESMGTECPLISWPEDISVLRGEYSSSPYFVAQIDTLSNQGYRTVIRAKGDGDCFYRALAFAYLYRLVHSASARKRDQLSATKTMLADAGFDEIVYELPFEFHRPIDIELYRDVHAPVDSAQMRLDQSFAAFLLDPDSHSAISVDDFRRLFVEPLGKEADNVQVTALVQALNVRVKIAYLDGHSTNGHVNFY
ncbi:hypothetical protein BU15DRAFT_75259 [Melanogaster broomeanus]|nr:hypothetical protein BU15DRAFT_75259 [Melanogaster broomeanus]